ncbi:maleylpyruvate isomerase family mycothiol-dependent enzyme [Nocardioides sp. KIGAM211]|uniref:Maleylpyruvate isomerase family mycothiol-dependent enzyme n=1 Tax=Nocardioides luti TaxID=2761101 RepID=A0A7X0RIR7_9ACTN|nr:maleylpyruvate isomerase family mycothiol-dependent enzyme [Nocardioides luti]MBB6629088.1 maleylpyruvate isomerase family mycothiol-dependent enzyme [Nocardioides luti]
MDPIASWQAAHDRVTDLVAVLGDAQLATRVPACPDWTVRDLLSHVVGLGSDVLAGDEPDDHHEAWTRAQVEARADRSARELLAEWADVAQRLPAWMQEHGSRPLNDVVIHEQDLRGALGVPGGRASDGLVIVRERMAERLGRTLAATDLPPLALEESPQPGRPSWSWCSAGAAADAAVLLRASGFDLARALTSRRTAAQLRNWTVRGDVAPYLDAFAGLGPLPSEPLPE